MKPLPFKIPKTTSSSFRIQVDEGPHFYDRLHYHPEWQLSFIQQGEGVLYLGHSFQRFSPGSIFLVGSNVPHLLQCDAGYYKTASPGVYAISLFFHQSSFGEGFFQLPELKAIADLLEAAQRGIFLTEHASLEAKIVDCLALQGVALFRQFLDIFDELSTYPKLQYLNEQHRPIVLKEVDGHRLNEVFQYTFRHFAEPISLEAIAHLANLSVSQFCRYFKLHTGKTYVDFLNELRIEEACKRLAEQDLTIAEVAHLVGFNNLSNFNRQFKRRKGLAPTKFRAQFKSVRV